MHWLWRFDRAISRAFLVSQNKWAPQTDTEFWLQNHSFIWIFFTKIHQTLLEIVICCSKMSLRASMAQETTQGPWTPTVRTVSQYNFGIRTLYFFLDMALFESRHFNGRSAVHSKHLWCGWMTGNRTPYNSCSE